MKAPHLVEATASKLIAFLLGFLVAIPWADYVSIGLKALSVIIAAVVGYYSIQKSRADKKKALKEAEYWNQKTNEYLETKRKEKENEQLPMAD